MKAETCGKHGKYVGFSLCPKCFHSTDATPPAPEGEREAVNVCEHGDHPAPEGKRFCSIACERCEHESDYSGCDMLCDKIIRADLAAARARAASEAEPLKEAAEALEEIASLHQQYDSVPREGQYSIGVVDGHRCAAQIARDALAKLRRERP